MSHIIRIGLVLSVIILLCVNVFAQQVKGSIDLKDFGEIPRTWKMVAGVSADWEHNHFLSTNRGTGILVNPSKSKRSLHLVSGFEHGDMELELEFMVSKGSNSGIYFQGRYEIQICDSWGKVHPNSGDAGGISQRWDKETRRSFEGKAPSMNVSKAPGLWQHFRIAFEAPKFDSEGAKVKNAKFVHVFQNGILIHENVEVTGPTKSAMFEDEKALGPIVIQGDDGPVAIRNIKYKPFGNPVPQIKDLRYTYHNGKFQSVEEFVESTPTETGPLNKITWDLGHGVLDFAYEYTGKLEIPESGDYTFSLTTLGATSLYLNGKNVLEDQNNSPRSKTLLLEQGVVPFKLMFYKSNYPGRRPQLGFFVEGPGIKKIPLHDANSYVEHVIQKPFYLEPSNEPMILRGFFRHGDKIKTHTVAIGEPSGLSFAYDLQQGALLSVWRGGFLDTSPMWRLRGQSQLMIPNGALIDLESGPAIARLDNSNSPWPDSLASDMLHMRGYFLDRERRPTFKYDCEQITVEDFFEPEMDGKSLARTIRYRNPEKIQGVYARIIAAKKIEDFGEGVYHINQGQLYVKLDNTILPKVLLRNSPSGQELLIPISTAGDGNQIKYSLIY